MRKPNRAAGSALLTQAEREAAARRARYVGSSEHKNTGWWGGMPTAGSRGRRLTTICPMTSDKDKHTATMWLRQAIASGQYKFVRGDLDFPKHVWYRDKTGKIWCGRCINRKLGTYKGWPITEAERRDIFD